MIIALRAHESGPRFYTWPAVMSPSAGAFRVWRRTRATDVAPQLADHSRNAWRGSSFLKAMARVDKHARIEGAQS